MRLLLLLLIFISCEKQAEKKQNDLGPSADQNYERIELKEVYNFNGHDFYVRLLSTEEASIYKNANNVYELKRDDGLQTILLRNRIWPNNISNVDSHINWYSDLPDEPTYKSKLGVISFEQESFTICRDEEDDSDPFEIVYVEVCDEFRSI